MAAHENAQLARARRSLLEAAMPAGLAMRSWRVSVEPVRSTNWTLDGAATLPLPTRVSGSARLGLGRAFLTVPAYRAICHQRQHSQEGHRP